ncbi:MAG: GNAT family N-acetyltransferase [Planctomycetota bacterium]
MEITIIPYAAPDDHVRGVAFFETAAQRDANIQPPSSAAWRAYVARSFNENGRDFAWAREGDRDLGLLMSYRSREPGAEFRHFRIIVHPDRRQEGIGARMLAHVEGQDADRPLLQANCQRSWEEGTRFLLRHGFTAGLEDLWMAVDDPPGPGSTPDGIRIRSYAPGPHDDAHWTRLNDEGYRGTTGYSALSADDLEGMRSEPGFRLRLAEDGSGIVGLCHVLQYADKHYINSLVVTPERRGNGIGRALLLDSLASLRDDGVARVHLTVRAENTNAAALYRSVGFETYDVSATYRRSR